MIDFHGTLMVSDGQVKKESFLSFYPIRKVIGFLSGFKFFIRISNSVLYPNAELIERLNKIGRSSSVMIFVVSAAHETARDIMEEDIKSIGLENFSGLILRDDFFESHTHYKVRIAKKLSADVVVEDCFHYGRAIKNALREDGKEAEVRCPDWHSILA